MKEEYQKFTRPAMRIWHHFKGEEVETLDSQRLIIGDDYRFKSNKVANHVYAYDLNTGRTIIIGKSVLLKKGKRWFTPLENEETQEKIS